MAAPFDFLDPRDCNGEDDRPPAWRRVSFLPSGLLHPGQRVRWSTDLGGRYDMEIVGFSSDVLASLWSGAAPSTQVWVRYLRVHPNLEFQVDANRITVLAEHTDADDGRSL